MTLILEPIQEHIFMGPLTALAAYYLFSIAPYIFLPAHFVSWIIADYLLLTVLQVKISHITMINWWLTYGWSNPATFLPERIFAAIHLLSSLQNF